VTTNAKPSMSAVWIALTVLQGFAGQTVASFSEVPSPCYIEIYIFYIFL
jgi:hypothetical protein